MMNNLSYDYLLDVYKIISCYETIKRNTKHREKIIKFEMFYSSNVTNILQLLKTRKYRHGRYTLFMINEPKARIIMSESMSDKIINHMISSYILFPLISPKLIETNVATRPNKGTKAGIYYMKKYINKLKFKYDKIYILKCDISKFFYSIDHEILINKMKKLISDNDLLNIIIEVINSTNYSYISDDIDKLIAKRKEEIVKLKISNNQKNAMINDLNRIPKYSNNKGLPIGNFSSQIFAIFYLNDLDHFIKEKLKIKYYIRYMDDFILIHQDKDYLKYCYSEIEKKVSEVKLKINNKTQICEIHDGVNFLGYKFKLINNRLYMLLNAKTKKRINRRLKNVPKSKASDFIKERYNGYLSVGNTSGFVYSKSYYNDNS